MLPVDAPKLPDFAREMRKHEKNKGTTGSTPSKLIPTPAKPKIPNQGNEKGKYYQIVNLASQTHQNCQVEDL